MIDPGVDLVEEDVEVDLYDVEVMDDRNLVDKGHA